MKRRPVLMVATIVLLASLAAPTVSAQPAAERVLAEVHPVVQLTEDGLGAEIRIRASCPTGYTVLEAVVYLVQNDFTSSMRGFSIPCDGRKRAVTVQVVSFDAPFTTGDAFVTSYLLVIDEAMQETLSGGERRAVEVW